MWNVPNFCHKAVQLKMTPKVEVQIFLSITHPWCPVWAFKLVQTHHTSHQGSNWTKQYSTSKHRLHLYGILKMLIQCGIQNQPCHFMFLEMQCICTTLQNIKAQPEPLSRQPQQLQHLSLSGLCCWSSDFWLLFPPPCTDRHMLEKSQSSERKEG